MDAKELQELADRCRRLAKAETNEDFQKELIALANEYQQRADALGESPATRQQRGQPGTSEDPS